MKSTHHLDKHDYRLCHFLSRCLYYNSIANPLIEIYSQLSTKRVEGSIYLVAPNGFFNIKNFVVEKVVENEM
jgi:hypothetical protein